MYIEVYAWFAECKPMQPSRLEMEF
jgi:hypothetical protein